jgi:hypothetical protein
MKITLKKPISMGRMKENWQIGMIHSQSTKLIGARPLGKGEGLTNQSSHK